MNRAILGAVALVMCTWSVAVAPARSASQKDAKKPLAGYTTISVERFTVVDSAVAKGFVRGNEEVLQQEIVQGLQKENLFSAVTDLSNAPPAAPGSAPAITPASNVSGAAAPTKPALLLVATITEYDKGSRAARWAVGFGAGASKLKVHFSFRDAQTGEELLQFDRQGKFYGVLSVFGGSEGHSMSKTESDILRRLVETIRTNR